MSVVVENLRRDLEELRKDVKRNEDRLVTITISIASQLAIVIKENDDLKARYERHCHVSTKASRPDPKPIILDDK
jgi:hypothetical protein